MTMAERITDDLVRRLERPEQGNTIKYDTEVAGFGIRVTAGGNKSFILNYRNAEGRERRKTIGAYGRDEWGVAAARKEAGKLRKEIALGKDPLDEQKKKRQAPTIADLCDRYIEDYLPSKRESSRGDDKSMIKLIIRPKLGNRKIASVRRADIKDLHRSMKDRPYRANRVLALLSTMFNFAINDLEWPVENKVKGVKRYQEVSRKRYLSLKDELPRLIEALAKYENQQAANVVRLCLLTGCRRGEALQATWAQFSFTEDEDVWTKPGATTKQKTEHRVPLSTAAVVLLKDILASASRGDDGELESEFVFPGRTADAPLSEIKDEWAYLRKAAKIPDVRLHDLRHTYASILASAGQSLPIIGALLGHTNPATTARYAHLFDDPLKKATDTVGRIVTGAKSAKVTPIRKDEAS